MSCLIVREEEDIGSIDPTSISRSVFVSGFKPATDWTDLIIHFQRMRNGGGDIECIIISKKGNAVITFEDPRVVSSVLQYKQELQGMVLTIVPYLDVLVSKNDQSVEQSYKFCATCNHHRDLPGPSGQQRGDENWQRQVRETRQREENLQRQLTEMQEQQENSQRQLIETQQREENSQRQLREEQQRGQNSQRQLRETRQRKENLQRQLTEMQRQQETLQRQLRETQQNSRRQLREEQQRGQNLQTQMVETQQREENLQRQLREIRQREENLQRQLANYQSQVSELQLSLSAAQLTINGLRNQGTRDWVISRDEIQMTDNCLGRGGWGSVYEGVYCGCTVAVKQIHELILSPHNVRLFEREMNIASKCRHPHLLQFIGATSDEGNPLFVTELMEKSLRTLLEERQLAAIEIRTISLDVARALSYLHQKKPEPIIHRDVSSANVLLWRQGDQWRAKVSDYGTANFMQQTLTAAPGAPIYSAPEALTSKQTVKVDVYCFGVLLCEMCIRELPDPTRRDEQVVLVTNGELRGLVRLCLQRDPGTRPTMQRIIDELKDFNTTS